MASHSNKRWWEEKPITLCALELHFQVMSQERFPFGLSFRRWQDACGSVRQASFVFPGRAGRFAGRIATTCASCHGNG